MIDQRISARTRITVRHDNIVDVLTFAVSPDIGPDPPSEPDIMTSRRCRKPNRRRNEFRSLVDTASPGPPKPAGEWILAASIDRAVIASRFERTARG